MGISTVVIGLLPTYAQIGVAAPLLLALCRFGQGFGLGGEWGGAVLLATENAPEGKRSWYGMFPQLGAPLGLFLSSGVFWILLHFMSQEALLSWGWRIPFVASIVLIAIGLWVRLSITETPEFQKAIDKARARRRAGRRSCSATTSAACCSAPSSALVTFVLFYICSAYLLSYNVKVAEDLVPRRAARCRSTARCSSASPSRSPASSADRFGRRELLIVAHRADRRCSRSRWRRC